MQNILINTSKEKKEEKKRAQFYTEAAKEVRRVYHGNIHGNVNVLCSFGRIESATLLLPRQSKYLDLLLPIHPQTRYCTFSMQYVK